MAYKKLTPLQISDLQRRFTKLDVNGNSALSFEEMSSFLRAGNPRMTDRELKILFKSIDKDKNGKVDWHEFIDFVFPSARATARASGGLCEWCKQPLSCEEEMQSSIRSCDGTVETTKKRLLTNDQISLRLPGISRTVALHKRCKEEYIKAKAMRCQVCGKPIEEGLVLLENPATGEKVCVHGSCPAAHDAGEETGALDAAEPWIDDGRSCFHCRKPFARQEGEAMVTDAKTMLQLPGLQNVVTLHSEGPCIDRYVLAHALRCGHCLRPIKDHMTTVQLPWATKQATLHQHCEADYVDLHATRCAQCEGPIRDRGVRLRSRGLVHFLHARCEANFRTWGL